MKIVDRLVALRQRDERAFLREVQSILRVAPQGFGDATLGQIAAAAGLTVEQVARALDEVQRSIPSADAARRE